MNDTHGGIGVLSVLVPVFNEEQTIVQVLRKVMALGALLKEIVVVDDGSKDRTADLVRELAGIMAVFYILFYNLIAPRMASGRRYIQEANRFLATSERRRGVMTDAASLAS